MEYLYFICTLPIALIALLLICDLYNDRQNARRYQEYIDSIRVGDIFEPNFLADLNDDPFKEIDRRDWNSTLNSCSVRVFWLLTSPMPLSESRSVSSLLFRPMSFAIWLILNWGLNAIFPPNALPCPLVGGQVFALSGYENGVIRFGVVSHRPLPSGGACR